MKSPLARSNITTFVAAGALVLAGLYAACSKSTEPPSHEGPAPRPLRAEPSEPSPHGSGNGPAPRAAAAEPTGAPAAGSDVAYDAPASWASAPNTNTMRKATYKIAKAAGDPEDAELTVTAAGGGVEPNVRRWGTQFGSEAKTEKRKVNGLDVTVVEVKGTYNGGMGMVPGGAPPKEKYMLLGATSTCFRSNQVGDAKRCAQPTDFAALTASTHCAESTSAQQQ